MKLAIFDCDGTLVDSGATIHRALETALTHHGHDCPPRVEAQRVIGLSLNEAMAALIPDADHEALSATYKDAFVSLRRRGEVDERPYEGIAAAIDRFEADGWLLAIATGKSDRGLDHVLDTLGWQGRFVARHTADRHPSKPHPSMIQACMNDTGAMEMQTVMIGDTAHDMRMARNANVGAIGVDWGYHDCDELHSGGAHVLATHPDELLTLSQGWMEGKWR